MARVSLLMAIGLALAMFPAAITDAKRAAPRAKHAAKEPIVHAQRWAHMRSVAKETGIVELHELQGRPLYARFTPVLRPLYTRSRIACCNSLPTSGLRSILFSKK